MARPKDRGDITPEIRGALKRAILIMEERGKPLSTIWCELFEEDPSTAMRLAISTMPKDMNVVTTDLTPEKWLELMADGSKPESTNPETTLPGPVH